MIIHKLHKIYKYVSGGRIHIALENKNLINLISPPERRIEKDEFHVSLKYYPKEDLFQIEIDSWNVSHHNGDPYGISKRDIPLVKPFLQETFGEGKYDEKLISLEEVLELMVSELEERAMIKSEKEYKILEEKERQLDIKAFLMEKLKHV